MQRAGRLRKGLIFVGEQPIGHSEVSDLALLAKTRNVSGGHLKMKKLMISAAVAGVAAVSMPSAAFAECGEVTVGVANWSTAEIVGNLDAFILETGYGCSVTQTPTATTTTLALAQGAASALVVSEFWSNGADADVLDQMLGDGEISLDAKPFPDAGEFWYVTPAFAEDYPEIDTVEKLIQRPDLFPSPTVDGAGAFWGCPVGIGWGCEHNNKGIFDGYDMASLGWNLENPASYEGQISVVTQAVLADEYWVGYYWTPTAVAINLGLVIIPWEAEFAGDEYWHKCVSTDDRPADCVMKPTAWVPSVVDTLTTPALEEFEGANAYVNTRVVPMAMLGAADAYMSENSASGMDTAKWMLANNEDVWVDWVSDEAADAIRAAL